VTFEELNLPSIQAKHLVPVCGLHNAQHWLHVETICHYSQFGHWALKFEDAKQARVAHNCKTVLCMIPEAGIISQFLEWTKDILGQY
jgi:hypothetical protein